MRVSERTRHRAESVSYGDRFHCECRIKLFVSLLFLCFNSKSSAVSGSDNFCPGINARSLSRSSLGSVSSDFMDSLPTSSTSSEHQSSQSPFPNQVKPSHTASSTPASISANPSVQFSSSEHIPLAFRSMNEMRKSGLLCDVHLVAGDGGDQIKCHKIVLAGTSAYFNAMFSSEYHYFTIITFMCIV